MRTKVVNLRKERYDVYIGRPGPFGNPYKVDRLGRAGALERYRQHFHDRLHSDKGFAAAVESLRGKTLGCFCKPQECHGDVIAEHLNSTETE